MSLGPEDRDALRVFLGTKTWREALAVLQREWNSFLLSLAQQEVGSESGRYQVARTQGFLDGFRYVVDRLRELAEEPDGGGDEGHA